MATINQRSPERYRAGEHRDRTEHAKNIIRRGPDKDDRETLSFGRRRRNVERNNRGSAAGTWNRWWRPPGGTIRSEKSSDRVLGERGLLEIDGRRQNVGRLARRARRRRLSKCLDQSEQSRHHPSRFGPGRNRHGERRQELELVV